jgi:outer membrane protein assembly factor BamB
VGGASFVYAGSDDGRVYALNKASGAVAWKTATGGAVVSSPAYANGVVYVGSKDQSIYALDAVTGAQRWEHKTAFDVEASPIVVNGVVYIGSGDGNLYALNATTGALIWKAPTGDLDADGNVKGFGDLIPGRAVFAAGALYFTSGSIGGSSVYAVNAADGKRLWRYQTSDFALDDYPAIANGILFFGGGLDDRSIYAFALS